jgi:hypothetical protein
MLYIVQDLVARLVVGVLVGGALELIEVGVGDRFALVLFDGLYGAIDLLVDDGRIAVVLVLSSPAGRERWLSF